MLDHEIVKFYNSVKDPLWPEIHSYADYSLLPNVIKDECDNLHDFNNRKKEICNSDYWINATTEICVYKDLAFVPIAKCAYVYYTTLFNNLGWEKVSLKDVDLKNIKLFGVVMHPLQRRLKGISQWLVFSYQKNQNSNFLTNPWIKSSAPDIDWDQLFIDIQSTYLKNIIRSVFISDVHSMPYSLEFGSLLDKINWIPMDIMSDNDVKLSMMNFFKFQGFNIQLPLDDKRLHISSDNQNKIFNIVKSEFYNNDTNLVNFHKLYSNDLKLYYNLIDTFSLDWQHI